MAQKCLIGVVSFIAVCVVALESQGTRRKIMIFGGKSHQTYLGCLNCPSNARDSIFNESGQYGRCPGPFSDNLFCRGPFREFGSSGPFQDRSACGSNATDPPVIVDEDGGYYGRVSVGGAVGQRVSACWGVGRLTKHDVCKVVKWVCEQ